MLWVRQELVHRIGGLTWNVRYRAKIPVRLSLVTYEKVRKRTKNNKAQNQRGNESPCCKDGFVFILHLYLYPQVSNTEGIQKSPQKKADDQKEKDQGKGSILCLNPAGILMNHGSVPLFGIFPMNTST